jgi:hypothetical protein
MTEEKTLPAGSSWREELDWHVYNAEEWLVKGPPSHLSSQTINGCTEHKMLQRTMQLKPIDFTPEMPACLPFTVAERLKPLMTSMSSPLFVSGSYDQPVYWGLLEGHDFYDEDDVACVEVLISSFSITGDNNRKLNLLFYRLIWKYYCHCGHMVLTCQFDSDKAHLLAQEEGKKKSESKKEKVLLLSLLLFRQPDVFNT